MTARSIVHTGLSGLSADAIGRNARIRLYPDGSADVLISSRPVFRESGWEERYPRKAGKHDLDVFGAELEYMAAERQGRFLSDGEAPPEAVASLRRAVRRARARVRTLARANPMRYFVTLTLDPQKVDRYDDAAVIRKASAWLSNQVQRRGLAYILVPERHQDGAIHFHGFFNDALTLVDSGTVTPAAGGRPRRPRSAAQRAALISKGGHVVYNVPGWSFGFSTALELYGDYPSAVSYVCKYIGKQTAGDLPERIGGRWYYSGGALREPVTLLCDLDMDEARQLFPAGYGFTVPEAGAEYYAYEMKGGVAHDNSGRATLAAEREEG